MPNSKSLLVFFERHVICPQAGHIRKLRPFPQLLHKRLDIGRAALRFEFHIPLGCVPDPSAEMMPVGNLLGEIAEPDTLHPSLDDGADALHDELPPRKEIQDNRDHEA
jgi:hypothetical protein